MCSIQRHRCLLARPGCLYVYSVITQVDTQDNGNAVKGHLSGPSFNVSSSSTKGTPLHNVKPYYCGVGPCHPKKLQWFASAKFFTFILCIYGLVEGALVTGKQLAAVGVHTSLLPEQESMVINHVLVILSCLDRILLVYL